LTGKQRAFAHFVAAGALPLQAARLAGYDATGSYLMAKRNMAHAGILALIEQLRHEPEKDNDTVIELPAADAAVDDVISAADVLAYFSRIMRAEGSDAKERMKAAEFLAKYYGLLQGQEDKNLSLVINYDYGDRDGD
jgi:hypothetical protein